MHFLLFMVDCDLHTCVVNQLFVQLATISLLVIFLLLKILRLQDYSNLGIGFYSVVGRKY